jgi:hypothetical protein
MDSSGLVMDSFFVYDAVVYSRIRQQKILKIMFSRMSGGKDGAYDKFVMTPNLIWYEKGNSYPRNYQASSQKNTMENWNELIGELKFTEFNKIKSGKRKRPANGVDYSLTIQTEGGFYNIINYSSHNRHYKKMNGFFNKLSSQTNGHYMELN